MTKEQNTKKPRRKTGLGRGLSALIPDIEAADAAVGTKVPPRELPLADLTPNPYQPRRHFDPAALEELTASIREQGLLQPVLVRTKSGGGYEIIAGERRTRAAKKAGLTHIPVVIRELDDKRMLQVSIVENIQRDDLNPVEEAESYYRLMEEFSMTQEQVAACVGKSRSAVANMIRLRQLPPAVKQSLAEGILSMGHGRALLGAADEDRLLQAFAVVLEKKLSVRETETLVRNLSTPRPEVQMRPPLPSGYQAAAARLSERFGIPIRIRGDQDKGRLEIPYESADAFADLLKRLDAMG